MNRYLIIALVWIASLIAVGAWQRIDGKTVERSAWQARDNAELIAANSAIKAMEEAARKSEQDHAEALDTIATRYEGKIQDATKQRTADLAAVRAGTLRLRDPAAAIKSCSDPMPGIAASPGVGDGRAAGELSGEVNGILSSETAEFLVSFASDADKIATQLQSCQAALLEDRKVW